MLFLRCRGGKADQVQAQIAQLLSGLGVVGLRIGAGFLQAVEIEAAAPFER